MASLDTVPFSTGQTAAFRYTAAIIEGVGLQQLSYRTLIGVQPNQEFSYDLSALLNSLDTVPFPVGSLQDFTYLPFSQILTGRPAVQVFRYATPEHAAAVQVFRYGTRTPRPLKLQPFSYGLLATVPQPIEEPDGACWQGLADAIMQGLAKPFTKSTTSVLYSLVSTVARELEGCSEAAVIVDGEARGNGTFTVLTQFEPIIAVASVAWVDAAGTVLEEYDVFGFLGRKIYLDGGTHTPQVGDYLRVSYTYLHKGLEKRVRDALLQLNVLTSARDFLDEWGRWFNLARMETGTYGTFRYGSQAYASRGRESDSQFSHRIIATVTAGRNTIPSILAEVRRITGGDPYIVEWFDPAGNNGWVYKVTAEAAWLGEADTRRHLIWGRTSRFLDASTPGGGACTFEVWIPAGSGGSAFQVLNVVNQFKATGTRAFIRYQ